MEKLIIKPTKYTPEILFDPDTHILEIRGESYPENISGFYEPVFEWLENYFHGGLSLTRVTVNVGMTYFNSSSSKMFFDFFDMLKEAAGTGIHVTVNWYYDEENEMIIEYGEEFQEDLSPLDFNLVKCGG